MTASGNVGRPRDGAIDDAVLRVAAEHLARHGYEAISLAAIAAEAGTTRQAVYRRWPTKADLAVAAIAALPEAAPQPRTGRHEDDLRAELAAFARGVARPGGVSLVGAMLQDGTDPELRDRYRAVVVEPRRARIRAIVRDAVADGTLPATTDLELAVASCTGAFYALALAGRAPGRTWPARMARHVFAAGGGEGGR